MKIKKSSLRNILFVVIFSLGLVGGAAIRFEWMSSCRAQKETPSSSQPPPVTYLPDNRTPSSFAALAKRVQAAVVNISTSKTLQIRRSPFDDFFGQYYQAMPSLKRQNSLGSGFILNKEGYILTNNHVVLGADEIQVKLSDGRVFDAKIVGTDPKTDVAVIKINTHEALPTLNLGNSDALDIGDWVVAIGNPFGLTHTVTAGIVSAKGRVIGAGPYDDFIQTDASINPGNSGGPLFNLQGEVVGINTAVIASGQGIGFAIPINLVKTVIPSLLKGGKIERGYLGIGLQELTPDLAKGLGLDRPEGALVATVYDNSPASNGGVKPGDLILSFNNHKIEKTQDLPILVAESPVGSEAILELLRDGQKKIVKVTLSSTEQMSKQVAATSAGVGVSTKLGVAVQDVAPQESQRQGIPPGKGVSVTGIETDGPLASVGIQPGDVILEINNQPINGSKEFQDVSQKIQKGQIVRLFIKRGPMTSFFAFRL